MGRFSMIPVITLWQPYASLMADGYKWIETRSWATKYRGDLGIHAGLKVMRAECEDFGYDYKTIPRGAILCIVNLVDVVRFPNPRAPPDEYGNFAPDRYGWLTRDLRVLPEPVPAKGGRMLWKWDGY